MHYLKRITNFIYFQAYVFLNNSPATGTLGSKVDTLYTIEYITGTNQNDVLVGDDSLLWNNYIWALSGDD